MEIDRGCFYRVVTEKLADGIEVVSVVQKVCSEGMS